MRRVKILRNRQRTVRLITSNAQYSEGDVVDTPDGLGVVTEIRTETFDGTDGEVDASEDSPAYVVAVEDEDTTVGFYTAGDLEAGEFPDDVPDDPAGDIGGQSDNVSSNQDGHFSWPESWRESDTPARLIALRAWAGMKGSHTGCVREMRGNVTRPNAFCADMKDRLLGWTGWRDGG